MYIQPSEKGSKYRSLRGCQDATFFMKLPDFVRSQAASRLQAEVDLMSSDRSYWTVAHRRRVVLSASPWHLYRRGRLSFTPARLPQMCLSADEIDSIAV